MDDVFRKSVFLAHGTGEVWMREKGKAAAVSLDSQRTVFGEATAKLAVGACKATLSLSCFVNQVSIHGKRRVFWPLPQLFEALSLKTHQGVPSRWISHSLSRWSAFLVQLTGDSQIITSNHGNVGEPMAVQTPYIRRCLPQSSMPT